MVSVWDFLTVLCFAMPITGAVAEARIRKVGAGGYALAVTAGLLLGVCCAWTMRAIIRAVLADLKRHPKREHSLSRQSWMLGTIYLAAALWMGIALFLGGRMTALLLHLVS